MSMTLAKNEKIFDAEVFSYFVELVLGCCLHSYNDFSLKVHIEV
jgi:hypothetical protein